MADDSETDEELEIELVPAADAAARLLALVAVARRGFLESPTEDLGGESPETERYDLAAWLREERLLEALTPAERELLDAPIGSLLPEDVADATWGIESAAVLAWALELLPAVPGYDQPADAAAVLNALPATWSRTTEFRTSARLRDELEIARAREQAEIWLERADLYWLSQEAQADGDAEIAKIVSTMAEEATAAGLIASPVAGDFPISGEPYRGLSPESVGRLGLIALARLTALNWLCGVSEA